MPSWRAALVYKPVPIGSIYFDAGTSFNPSAESLSLSASTCQSAAGEEPDLRSRQQMGLPAQPAVAARGRCFQTDKLNAREPDPNNPLLNVLAGTQRVNGVQLEVDGPHHQPLGSALKLRLSRRQAGQLELLSGGDRRAARQRSAQHLQLLEHTTVCPGAGRPASEAISSPAAPPVPPRRSIPYRPGEGSPRLLGLQRHGQASADRAHRSAGERL